MGGIASGSIVPARRLQASGVYVAGRYKQGPDYRIVRSGGANEWLILFTADGCGSYLAGREYRTCALGDAVIFPAGIPHDYRTAGEMWEFDWAHFIPCEEWFAKIKFPPAEGGVHAVHIRNPERRLQLDQAFRTIRQNQYVDGKYREVLALNVMETIFIVIAQEYGDQTDNPPLDPRVAQAMQYMSGRLNEPLRLEEIAGHVALSPSRLSHLFKKETGQSLMDTFAKMRLRHAANLLKYTPHTVEHIAEQTGFSSVYYFSSAFKKYAGVSPTAYRQGKAGC